MNNPWRAKHFGDGYSAEYLPIGQRTWRIVRSGGKPIEFPTRAAAEREAEAAYLRSMEPSIRATRPVDPERVAAKLADEAENWLKSKREDRQAQTTIHKAGKRPVLVLQGKASA
ncbi:MAG: hypothetical protein PS018_03275 [bacterium]|nr:hypothetical protein [bacterium]